MDRVFVRDKLVFGSFRYRGFRKEFSVLISVSFEFNGVFLLKSSMNKVYFMR